MKTLQALVLTIGLLLVAQLGFAQTKDEHEGHHPDSNGAAAASQPDNKDEAEMGAMKSMQKNMKAMHELMEKLNSSTDPEKKAQLLKQHMQAMRKQMKSMGSMGGGKMMGMMEGDQSGQGTKKKTGDMAMMCATEDAMKSGETMMKCHRMMQARMDMMQQMMEQMMEHEGAEEEMQHNR